MDPSESGRHPAADRRPSGAQFGPKDNVELQISEQLEAPDRLHNRPGRWGVRMPGGDAPADHEENVPESRR